MYHSSSLLHFCAAIELSYHVMKMATTTWSRTKELRKCRGRTPRPLNTRTLDGNREMGQHFEQGRNVEDSGGNLIGGPDTNLHCCHLAV